MANLKNNQNMRVFFALWPSPDGRDRLGTWQKRLVKLAGGRAMRTDTLHATLVFIGEIIPDKLETLLVSARQVSVEPFELCLDEAHYWKHNCIVYAAPAQSPHELARLVGALEELLDRYHCPFDRRAYHPHVTLLRNARWGEAPLPAMQPVCWQVKDFVLVQSVQQQGAVVYRVLARFPLIRHLSSVPSAII